MEYDKYQPTGTFEKCARLLEMAMRDKAVADLLLTGPRDKKQELLNEVGLTEDEVFATVDLINKHFHEPPIRPRTEAIFW